MLAHPFLLEKTMTNKQTLKRLANEVAKLKQDIEALSVKQAGKSPDDIFELMDLLESKFRGIEVDEGKYGGELKIVLSKKLSSKEMMRLTMLEEEGEETYYEVLGDHLMSVWGPVRSFLDKLYSNKWDVKDIDEDIRGNVYSVYTTITTPAL